MSGWRLAPAVNRHVCHLHRTYVLPMREKTRVYWLECGIEAAHERHEAGQT